MNPNQIPIDEKIDFAQQKSITNTLLDLPYQDIIKKFDKKDFFNKVLSLGVDNDIILLRDLMVEDFVPNKKALEISRIKRDQIIELLAISNAAITETSLKQIDPILSLPKSFDQTDYQKRAGKIWNAMQNIKMSIAETISDEYLGDVHFFLKAPPNNLSFYLKQVDTISEKLIQQYEKVIKTGKTDKIIVDEAINFIGQCGRTPIFTNSLKDRQNIGDIADIISKIERAIKMVQNIYAKKIINPTPEQIHSEIQNYIISDTHL
ncbi:MAG: hypothetical protein M1429_02210 [Patescibacteria group bacterium]|nr:hypothetical protein [Patescibacteria group bacterium]